MRYSYVLILPTIISLWIIFKAYKTGLFTSRSPQKKFFLIVNHSENLSRSIKQKSEKRNEVLYTLVPKEKMKPTHTEIDKVVRNSIPKHNGSHQEVKAMPDAENEKPTCSKDGENLGKIISMLHNLILCHQKYTKLTRYTNLIRHFNFKMANFFMYISHFSFMKSWFPVCQ